ncbi:MAG: tyrosine--tRNA ligase, partial [Planctomycetota bacterium]
PVPPSELAGGAVWVVTLLRLAGCAATNGEARRLVEQGGVRLGRDADSLEVVDDPTADLPVADGAVLKVGRRRFFRLRTG